MQLLKTAFNSVQRGMLKRKVLKQMQSLARDTISHDAIPMTQADIAKVMAEQDILQLRAKSVHLASQQAERGWWANVKYILNLPSIC